MQQEQNQDFLNAFMSLIQNALINPKFNIALKNVLIYGLITLKRVVDLIQSNSIQKKLILRMII